VSSGIVIQYFYLSVYSDSVLDFRKLSFLPYGHPKTGTHTLNLADAFALILPSFMTCRIIIF